MKSPFSILMFGFAGFIFLSCRRNNDHLENTISVGSFDINDFTRVRMNQMLVVWKKPPVQRQIDKIKEAIKEEGINTDSLTIRRCNNCTDSYVELWEAPRIETVIKTEGVTAGSTANTKGKGEDSLAYYSVNLITNSITPRGIYAFAGSYDNYGNVAARPLPAPISIQSTRPLQPHSGKKRVVVAVIDVGIDTALINPGYLWEKKSPAKNGCFENDKHGWNFMLNNSKIHDNNFIRHGTVIAQFIINEFAKSSNYVRIMVLKTHDEYGIGDLFSNICAIHYAMENGANIINASWGFYSESSHVFPYLDTLITQKLRDKGILFMAAAGNKVNEFYSRDIGISGFYPACLSSDTNNVITVTTANTEEVSSTQNYSNRFVNMGINPDTTIESAMKFSIPFPFESKEISTISGSSFATAIATGIIGAHLDTAFYQPGIGKQQLFDQLRGKGKTKYSYLLSWFIRDGWFSTRTSNDVLKNPN